MTWQPVSSATESAPVEEKRWLQEAVVVCIILYHFVSMCCICVSCSHHQHQHDLKKRGLRCQGWGWCVKGRQPPDLAGEGFFSIQSSMKTSVTVAGTKDQWIGCPGGISWKAWFLPFTTDGRRFLYICPKHPVP